MNPSSQYGNARAQGQGVQKNVKSKFSQAKAVQSKTAKLNKPVVIHMLVFLLIGLIIGCSVFIPFYSKKSYSILSFTFLFFSMFSVFLGWINIRRARKKIDWFMEGGFFPGLLLTLGAAFTFYLGCIAIYILIPAIFSSFHDPFSLSLVFLMPSPALLITFPYLLNITFEKAFKIEEKEYQLWTYPENYIEKQPTWNRERIIYANLHFKRIANQNMVTTIKVKLPKEAIFGELIYLFIRDYNDNRSPDNPIRQLKVAEGIKGWLFWTKNSGPKALFKKQRLIDVNKTIEENNLTEDTHIYFERIFNES